jgi:two-component system cell cycle sensor histidine kinase/response regulator CckA
MTGARDLASSPQQDPDTPNQASRLGSEVQLATGRRISFQRFFNQTPMAIAAVDLHGTILDSNERFRRLKESLDNTTLPSESVLSIVTLRDRATLEQAIRKAAINQTEASPIEVMLEGSKERWGQFFVTAATETSDSEIAIVYMLETTERHVLENQVNQAQKMDTIGQLAGGIAHDFNNVLSAIMMANDFLLNSHTPTDPSFQDIMQIKQNATRAATLVRQLLAFSRKQTLRPQVLDLAEALTDIDRLLKRLIGEKISLEIQHGRDLWRTRVDLSQFEQVIVNLAVNARDAMPDGGKLTIRTVNVPATETANLVSKGIPVGDYVRVDVTDTGTGISSEILDKIFEPFFSTKEVGKGSGLGLSTVYGIIKQTGGFILLDSTVGEGTSFHVFLPRHDLTTGSEDAPTVQSYIAPPKMRSKRSDMTGRETILLVEDEDSLRSLNARGLRSRGYKVIEASNGIEALEQLDWYNSEIDLVISNVVMPHMDGPMLLKAIREHNPSLKFIFVSGYAEDAFEASLSESAHFEFLPKPFTLSMLIEKIKDILAGA